MSGKKSNLQTEVTISKSEFKASVVKHLHCTLGTDENKANNHAWWKATCAAMQEQVLEGLRKTQKTRRRPKKGSRFFNPPWTYGDPGLQGTLSTTPMSEPMKITPYQ